MRKIAVVLVLIIAIGVATPFGMGYMAERQIKKIAHRLSDRPQVTVTVENYQRGYMNSQATLKVAYKAVINGGDNKPQSSPMQATFELKQKISHGPILSTADGMRLGMAYAESDLVLSDDTKAALNEIFKDQDTKPEFIVDSMIHVNGSSEHKFRVPTYKFKGTDKTTLTTSGVHGSWEMSSNLDYHTGVLNFGNFVAKDDTGGVLRVNAPEIIFEINQNDIGLFTGKSRVSFPSFEILNSGVTTYQIKNLEFNSTTDIDRNDLYNMSLDGGFENIMIAKQNYGPLVLKTSMRNLDASKIIEVQRLVDQMQDPGTAMEQQQLLLFSLMAKIPEIFNRGAEVLVEPFSLTLPQGKMEIVGNAKLVPSEKPKAAINPFTILQRLNGQMKITVPKSVAHELMVVESADKIRKMEHYNRLRAQQQNNYSQLVEDAQPKPQVPLTPAQIQQKAEVMADSYVESLLSNGYVKVDGDNYVIDAKMVNGILTVNGKRLPNQMLGL